MTKWRDTGAYRKRRGLGKARSRRRRSVRYLLGDDETTPSNEVTCDDDETETLAMMLPKEPEKKGFFSRLFSRDKPERKTQSAAHAASRHDFVREILSVPRGIARLDAFERILKDESLEACAQTPVALAYHRELTSLAQNANIELSLLSQRAKVCADALLRTGEVEKAGEILARIGDQRKASELFVQAGAVEKLERLHRDSDLQRGTRLAGRMAYDRFEGFFALGLRQQALEALNEAAKLWPENGIYLEIADGFRERAIEKALSLKAGKHHFELIRNLPLVIGRGEASAMRLNSPLVSRAHVEIRSAGVGRSSEVVVHDLQGRGDVMVGALSLKGKAPLPQNTNLSIAGVQIEIAHDGVSLSLKYPDQAKCLLVPLGEQGLFLLEGALHITFDKEHVFAEPCDGLKHEGTLLKRPLMLLRGDILQTKAGLVHIL